MFGITTQQYAQQLVRSIREDWTPEQLKSIGSWEGLYVICDANEYIALANEIFRIDPWVSDSDVDAGMRFINDAQDLASEMLGWTKSVTPA